MLCNHGYQLDYIILNFREALFEGCSFFRGRMLLQSMVAEKDTPVTVQKVDPAWFRARPGPVPGRLRFPLQIPSNYVVGVVTSVNVINVTWLLKKDLLQSLEALSESLCDKVSELRDKDSSIEEDMAGKTE